MQPAGGGMVDRAAAPEEDSLLLWLINNDDMVTYLYTSWCFPACRPVDFVPDRVDTASVAHTCARWLHFLVGVVLFAFWASDPEKLENESEGLVYVRVIFVLVVVLFALQFAVWRCVYKGAAVGQSSTLDVVNNYWSILLKLLVFVPCFLFWLGCAFWVLEGDFILWNKKEHLFTLTHQATALGGSVCILLYLEASRRRGTNSNLTAPETSPVDWGLVPLMSPVLLATLALAVYSVYDVIDRQDQTSYPHPLVLHLLVAPILFTCAALSLVHFVLACMALNSWLGSASAGNQRRNRSSAVGTRQLVYCALYLVAWSAFVAYTAYAVISNTWQYQTNIESHVATCDVCGAPAFLRYIRGASEEYLPQQITGTSYETTHGVCSVHCTSLPESAGYTVSNWALTRCRLLQINECCSHVTAVYSLGEHCGMRIATINSLFIYFLCYCFVAAATDTGNLVAIQRQNAAKSKPPEGGSPLQTTSMASVAAPPTTWPVDEATGLLIDVNAAKQDQDEEF